MVSDSTQCFTNLPRRPRPVADRPPYWRRPEPCLTIRRGACQWRQYSLSPGSRRLWWYLLPAVAEASAEWESVEQGQAVTVRDLLCPGCQRRADQLGVFPA